MPRRSENRESKRYTSLYTNVHSSIIYNSQKVETIQVSTDGWIDKQNVVHSCNRKEILKGRKFWHMLQCGWTLRITMLSKVNQAQKDKYCLIPLAKLPRVVKFIERKYARGYQGLRSLWIMLWWTWVCKTALWDPALNHFRYIPRIGIDRWYDNSIFNFLRKLYNLCVMENFCFP